MLRNTVSDTKISCYVFITANEPNLVRVILETKVRILSIQTLINVTNCNY